MHDAQQVGGVLGTTDRTVIGNGSRDQPAEGADNPDSLRACPNGPWFGTNTPSMDASVWPEVIRPALADLKGSALFIGTPKGSTSSTPWARAHPRLGGVVVHHGRRRERGAGDRESARAESG